ncbi:MULTISPECIES: tetratricopeptide repeat protein [Leptolyngbya]|uniref:tetratricopeptide repeat protein n=1 Tax=Leptolyngbya TaxID=47251 RepID=UPI001F550424|nr:tetratricopeptide repeat protein [Leptolyngbya sp. FACHB-1624]
MSPETPVDFFISYNHHDRGFAAWIAWILEAESYRVVIQAWDFGAGGNFVLEMQKAASEAKRTIAVLSKYSLESGYVQAEWAAAFAKDSMGLERSLIPIRVGECTPQGLWAQIVYVDLVGVEEAEAEERVVQAANRAVTKERGKPSEKPEYPRSQIESKPVYPPSIPENLPRLSDVFVGRTEDLKKLHEQVKSGKPTAISAIAGMGGIGKTELAAQYASQQRDLGVYPGGVLWLSARTDLSEQIIEFARYQLQLNIPEDVEPERKVQDIWKQWQQKETLIVLDDVKDYGAIQRFLPPQRSYFKVLLTTRSRFGSPVQNYEIKVLSEAASLELLRSLVGDGRIDQDLDTAKRVCEWLGYLPLGLELVGRYLARKKGTSIAKLWERLQAQRLAAKALLEAEPGMTATLGVVAAFELSWQELNEDAQRLAMLLSLFALAEIPWSLVQACLPDADEEELEDLRDQQLVNLSLLSFERDGMYQIHQLLREFFAVKRSTMPEEEAMKRSFCAVMSAIAEQMPGDWTLSSIEQFSATMPHLKEATTTLEPWLVDNDIYKPATRLGQFYEGQAAFAEAEEWYLHCRSISTQRLGESHPDVATSLNNLAGLYESQGRYEEAEPLLIQALELYRSLLGETHPDVASSLNNLAGLYYSQGRYEEAEPLYVQALELRRSLLGETHPDVASSLNNLAGLYYSQGRYEEAEPLYMRSLAISERALGVSHPTTMTIRQNYSTCLKSMESAFNSSTSIL